MRILLVRLSSIGDVVHTLPAFAALRREGHALGWIVEAAARELLLGQDGLEELIGLPKAGAVSFGAVVAARRALRAARYDSALDFQGLWKSALWARLSGARDVVGFERRARKEPASRLLLRRTVRLPREAVHVIDKNLSLLRAVGIEAVGSREFPLPLSSELTETVAARLKDLGLAPRSFAILNPGGGWDSKRWPAERFGELGRRLGDRGITPIVTFGPGDEALAGRAVAASEGVARRSFPTTLREFAALAREAAVVIAADTGPLQIACAVRTPVVALFGPTDPARNGPFDAADVVVAAPRPACFPCYRRNCRTHAGVMEAIGVDDVVSAVDTRLVRARRAV